MESIITFKIQYHWTENGLVIECPSPAARDFVARSLDENILVIKVKKKQRSEGEH